MARKTIERLALLKSANTSVKKQFKDAVSESASKALVYPDLWISTGSLALDRLCSGRNPGGIPVAPCGRVIHIGGEWSTGKSLLLDHFFKYIIVDLQGLGNCSETEGTRDPHFADAIGLPLDLLNIQRPVTIEEMFDQFMSWHADIRKQDEKIPILWGVDSLDSTEAEKSAGKAMSESGGWHFGGGRSEALGAGLRKIANAICARYPTTVVLLNQTRDNVGVMFGPKKRTTGGNPPHFYCVDPKSRILTADLRWVPAGDLLLGDQLLAFDEFSEGKHKRRKTIGALVTHNGSIRRRVLKLVLSDGTMLRSSFDHPWLTVAKGVLKGRLQKWRTATEINARVKSGHRTWLPKFLDVWDEDLSHNGGWLAGMLDGEGCIHFRRDGSKGAGEWGDRAKVLGSLRPIRLLEKFTERVTSGAYRADISSRLVVEILDVIDEGEQDVIALETTSHTYFAEGFGAHNSSLELMLRAAPRGDNGYRRADANLPKLSGAAVKRLGLMGMTDKGNVIGRYIRATCTKTKIAQTFETFADFYLDFTTGVKLWKCLDSRLIMEGKLVVDTDGESGYTMQVDGKPVTLKTKQEWLTWVSEHMEVLG